MTSFIDEFEFLKREVLSLDARYRLAFVAACCERLFPTYSAFSRAENFGNPVTLREGLDEVWNVVFGQPINPERIERLKESCIEEIPSEEQLLESSDNDVAQLVAIAVREALTACITSSSEAISNILACTLNTLAEYIRTLKDIEDINWPHQMNCEEQNREIGAHPFVLRELAKQREDLQLLQKLQALERERLEWLRTSYHNEGKSLIDLS